ncbi:MAG: DnaD domain protein [Absicoccus sp.]|uniref:DnaD domain protein n=1 Tax=Absicoccus sp. TaxID=2718527 RepID=UPI002A74B0C4|nr:DnaD domain protein [Absicoccus sp.]MDY3036050.1 DnaD domain protein [Absicoccus sp.]
MSDCKIILCDPWTEESLADLYFLYLPLLDHEAIGLYQLFRIMADVSCSQDELIQASGLSSSRFVQARKNLEQFHLIKTYHDIQSRSWLYHIFAPLDARSFLVHDTYSRLFLQAVGKQRFDQIKTHFTKDMQVPSTMKEISEPCPVEKLDGWSEEDEKLYHDHRPHLVRESYDFDFDTFLQGMDQIFPMRLRTEQNLTRIAQLATIHGIDAKVMKRYVMRAINPNTHVFDFGKLKAQVYHNKTKVESLKDPYALAPVAFMQQRQKGVPVASSDRKVIEKIMHDYHFSNEVMNVLIEYTLKTSHQKFPRSYVEKIAASWVRLGIDSKEKALAQIQAPSTPSSKQAYPSWYTQVQQEEASDELKEEILKMQEQLEGDSHV